MGRPKGRNVIVCWTEELRFIGVFLNSSHAAETLPHINENTAKVYISEYLRGRRTDCEDHIFIRHEIDSEPINTYEIREKTKKEARRKLKIIQLKRKIDITDINNLQEDELDQLLKQLKD